jgi:pimeloyl-ACP methyl ester carboxylesterase
MNQARLKQRGEELFKTSSVEVKGIKINYAEAGQGKAVIAVHGWTNNWLGFVPVGCFLHDRYKIISIDLPGFGDSGRLPKYNLELQAEYLYEFIKKLKIDKPIIMGHSMGTYVVAKFCQMHPDIARKIILISPMLNRNNKTKRLRMTKWFFLLIQRQNLMKTLWKRIIDTDRYSYFTAKYINMYKYDKQTVEIFGFEGKKKVSKEALVDMGVEIAKTNIDDLIVDNATPIQFIFGKYDKLTNIRQARKLFLGKGKYRFDEINNAGHVVTVEKPEEVANKIDGFVSGRLTTN